MTPRSRNGWQSEPKWRPKAGAQSSSPFRTTMDNGPAAPFYRPISILVSGASTASPGRPLLGASAHWEEGGQLYWEGEVEECINGRTVADRAYFGIDVSRIVERLTGERLDDGGWNCERVRGSLRSSFASTINVLEGLLEFERSTGGTPQSREACSTGEKFLLERNLFRRLGTGEPADERFLRFLHPNRWRYDILRALDYFRSSAMLTGADPDPRLGEAIGHLRSRRSNDGRWLLDWTLPGRVWFHVNEAQGQPSRWITLRAMRVLRWWDRQASIRH
ncbi:hypothetical protein NXC14_CH02666 [Rhizobium sp. NXC14]|nr:hypothetical protein NXC14_CH02666 [Rhizobium sp. NXC14]